MRLSPDEIHKHSEHFAGWQSPSEMRAYAKSLADSLGSADYFNQPGLSFLREAWVAAEFGERRGAVSVRRLDVDRPDIALRFSSGEIESFEVVEADQAGRTRGREYRFADGPKPMVADWPVEEWATAEQCFAAVRAQAGVKALKAQKLHDAGTPYPPETRLLILLNLADFGAHQQEIEATFHSAIEPARRWFRSVWILWQGNVYQP